MIAGDENVLINPEEILETIRMVQLENFDIRTVTLGISLHDCSDSDINVVANKVYDKIVKTARNLSETVNRVSAKYGVPIVNKRIAVTPISYVAVASGSRSYKPVAEAMER